LPDYDLFADTWPEPRIVEADHDDLIEVEDLVDDEPQRRPRRRRKTDREWRDQFELEETQIAAVEVVLEMLADEIAREGA
jgi:hypothetical protein